MLHDALRARIIAMELGRSERRMLPLGLAEIDEALQGGLDLGVLHELTGPAAISFAHLLVHRQGGPVFWLAPEAAEAVCYPPGLWQYGAPAADFMMVRLTTAADLLKAAYEVLSSDAAGSVLLELPGGLSLTEMRRLQIAAQKSAVLGLVLKADYLQDAGRQAGLFGSAMTRWYARMTGWTADGLQLELHLTKNRRGRPHRWTVESDHATHHLRLAAVSGEREADPPGT